MSAEQMAEKVEESKKRVAEPFSQAKKDKIMSAMAKLNLQKPSWAAKVPEEEWLGKMFMSKRLD